MAKAITEIRSIARAHTKTAINVLAGIMNQEKAPASARVTAATALLDRGWGKAVAAIEVSSNVSLLDCLEALNARREADAAADDAVH